MICKYIYIYIVSLVLEAFPRFTSQAMVAPEEKENRNSQVVAPLGPSISLRKAMDTAMVVSAMGLSSPLNV